MSDKLSDSEKQALMLCEFAKEQIKNKKCTKSQIDNIVRNFAVDMSLQATISEVVDLLNAELPQGQKLTHKNVSAAMNRHRTATNLQPIRENRYSLKQILASLPLTKLKLIKKWF